MKASHKIAAWAMIAVLFTHSMGMNLLYSLYAVDQTIFIELFCVNKDKPEMHCNGSCMLSKLDDQHHHNSDKPELPDLGHFQLFYCIQRIDYRLHKLKPTKISFSIYCVDFYDSQYQDEIFRPPILV